MFIVILIIEKKKLNQKKNSKKMQKIAIRSFFGSCRQLTKNDGQIIQIQFVTKSEKVAMFILFISSIPIILYYFFDKFILYVYLLRIFYLKNYL